MNYQDHFDSAALEQYASALNTRAKQARACGWLSPACLRSRILESGGRCEWCGKPVVNAAFELDHIISLKQRGSNTAENLAVACPDCNRQKGQKHPARFAAEIGLKTRRKTQLVQRILRHYAMESLEQAPLFDEPEATAEIQRDNSKAPQYRW